MAPRTPHGDRVSATADFLGICPPGTSDVLPPELRTMHRYSFSPLLVVACSLLLVQCGGGGDSGGNQVSGGALEGVVSTKEGAPLADVFVSAYGASAKSDGSGRFRIENVALPADRVVATLQKDGYFSLTVGTRAAPAGETTNVRAVLLPRELVGEIDGTHAV
ncbi:MAG: carboxypeptidase-like regulatory domain-containing protein [Polyangiaceae bacterium]|nr:carboxypeptidase-like regulatory domain-containing protein [Polyangiaceae bacterium]